MLWFIATPPMWLPKEIAVYWSQADILCQHSLGMVYYYATLLAHTSHSISHVRSLEYCVLSHLLPLSHLSYIRCAMKDGDMAPTLLEHLCVNLMGQWSWAVKIFSCNWLCSSHSLELKVKGSIPWVDLLFQGGGVTVGDLQWTLLAGKELELVAIEFASCSCELAVNEGKGGTLWWNKFDDMIFQSFLHLSGHILSNQILRDYRNF